MNLSYCRWLFGVFLLPVAVGATACAAADGSYSGGWDASGAYDSGVPPTVVASLDLLAPDHTVASELVPGEVLTVEVQLIALYGGTPEGLRVDFALLGQSMDSSLSALYGTTDANGKVQVFLRAGQTPTSFQLRVSYGSSTSYVPVTVSPTVLVALGVSLDPSITQYVKNVSVEVYAARSCGDIAGVPPSASFRFVDGSTTVDATGLSAGTHYAVLAKATDPSGAYPYETCLDVDDPSVSADVVVDFGLP